MGKQIRPRLTPQEYSVIEKYRNESTSNAKILIFDIETAPIRAYVWGLWQQNVAPIQIQSDWFCLTWAAKWLFSDHVYSSSLKTSELKGENDKRIIKQMWELLNQADIVVSHNGDKFDIKRLNTRFLVHNIKPPLPYKSIDTLKHLRRNFSISSNKLDYVNKVLGLERKLDTGGFELWDRCMKGERLALLEMEQYNIQDVKILEETYLYIRPWIKPHPNIGLYIEEDVACCPNCGSKKLTAGGQYTTFVNVYEAFRCDDCGAVGRSRKSSLPSDSTKNLMRP